MMPFVTAAFFGLCFALLGYMGVNGKIPPLNLFNETTGPAVCGAIGVAMGFWLGNR